MLSSTYGDGRRECSGHIYVLDGDKWKPRNNGYETRRGGCGFGLNAMDVSYTLNTIDRHIVATTN